MLIHFTLVQKVKHRVNKIHAFLNKAILCQFHLKMTCTSCTDEVREKVPSFQMSHFFYDINQNTEPLSINVFVCLKMLLTTVGAQWLSGRVLDTTASLRCGP